MVISILKSPNEVDICPDFSKTYTNFVLFPSIIMNNNAFHPQTWMIDYIATQGEDPDRSETYGFNALSFNFIFYL